MADDLLQVLTRFHREVIAPDLDRRDERLGTVEQKLDEVLTHFDAIYHRFDRLESGACSRSLRSGSGRGDLGDGTQSS